MTTDSRHKKDLEAKTFFSFPLFGGGSWLLMVLVDDHRVCINTSSCRNSIEFQSSIIYKYKDPYEAAGICMEWFSRLFEQFLKFLKKKHQGCNRHIQRENLSTSVLYQLEARKGPTFTFIAHHWKIQGSGMVILTQRRTRWKLSMPQILQKPWNHSAGEKVRSLFPAPCWKVFFFASRKRFILWAQQNQCVVGGWWHMFFSWKKGWRRWCYIQI